MSVLGSLSVKTRVLLLVGVVVGALALVAVSRHVLQANILSQTPGSDPTSDIFVSARYVAAPRERGSVVIQAGRALAQLEGLRLTLLVDPSRAGIVSVRRPGVTQTFAVATDFPSPGVVHVALLGGPRDIAAGAHLLEVELQLADNSVNRPGDRIDLRLVNVGVVLGGGGEPLAHAVNGQITIQGSQNALQAQLTPAIIDIVNNVLLRDDLPRITIRGQVLPTTPQLVIGGRVAIVIASSPTEVVAAVPRDLPRGVATVSLGSLTAEEGIVLLGGPGAGGAPRILDDLIYFEENPLQKLAGKESRGDIVLWIPVVNSLGPTDPVRLSVDLTSLRGEPALILSGAVKVGKGQNGEDIIWFRVPPAAVATRFGQGAGSLKVAATLPTDTDYTIRLRVENRLRLEDDAVAVLHVLSTVNEGSSPTLTEMQVIPATGKPPGAVRPGDGMRISVRITDNEGITTIALATADLRPIGGRIVTLLPSVPASALPDAPLKSLPYSMLEAFEIPRGLPSGTYTLPLRVVDQQGNEGTASLPVVVHGGGVPQFDGRLEAFPAIASPGGKITVFGGVKDGDGAKDIVQVTADFISLGGTVVGMAPTVADLEEAGPNTVVYQASFDILKSIALGTYSVALRATDSLGQLATATITVNVVAVAKGGPPTFSGRQSAIPSPAAVGDIVEFTVEVSDPQGPDTLKEVSIDLRDVRGTIVKMTPLLSQVGLGSGPLSRPYSARFTLPGTVIAGGYLIPVKAVDEDGNIAGTTIPLQVSAQAVQGSPPVITRVIVSPPVVLPDGETDVEVQVQVEDPNGADDVAQVQVDLTPVAGKIESLRRSSTGNEEGARSALYEFTLDGIPAHVRTGGYDLTVEVRDKAGHRATRTFRLTVGTSLGGSAPTLISARFVPDVVSPAERKKIRFFAEVEDANGVEDLTVVVDLTRLQDTVRELSPIVTFEQGAVALRNTFVFEDVRIPADFPLGTYEAPVTIMDPEGNVVRSSARLRVDRAAVGQAPRIDVSSAFQDPRAFANDGEEEGSLHVLIRDPEDDVQTAVVNFRSLARAPSTGVDETANIPLFCGASPAIACMRRSVPEASGERWFILEKITVPPTTLPSEEPYQVSIIAIDAEGNTDEAKVPLVVGGEDVGQELTEPPALLAVVPVGDQEMEILFSQPLDTSTIDRRGSQFVIRDTLNAHVEFTVSQVSWDTTKRILYAHNNALRSGETYTLSVRSPANPGLSSLTSVIGTPFPDGPGSHVRFRAFSAGGKPPAIERVEIVSPHEVVVRFRDPVLPSSVHPNLLPFRASFVSLTDGTRVAVRGGSLTSGATELHLIASEDLVVGDRYELRVEGVLAPGLLSVPQPGLTVRFLMESVVDDASKTQRVILSNPDLNGDGTVNFDDFVLFSSVYNTNYDPITGESTTITGEPIHGAAGEEDDEGDDEDEGGPPATPPPAAPPSSPPSTPPGFPPGQGGTGQPPSGVPGGGGQPPFSPPGTPPGGAQGGAPSGGSSSFGGDLPPPLF